MVAKEQKSDQHTLPFSGLGGQQGSKLKGLGHQDVLLVYDLVVLFVLLALRKHNPNTQRNTFQCTIVGFLYIYKKYKTFILDKLCSENKKKH